MKIKLTIFLTLLFALLFTACQNQAAGPQPTLTPVSEPASVLAAKIRPPDLRGTITDVSAQDGNTNAVRIEGDPHYDIADIHITDQTRIYIIQDHTAISAAAGQLENGMQVEVLFTGGIRERYPISVDAEEILVIAGPDRLPSSTQEPTVTSTPTLLDTPSPVTPTRTHLPVTQTYPDSLTRTTLLTENGISWIECNVPYRDYAMGGYDVSFLQECVKLPDEDNAKDKMITGERVETSYSPFTDLKIAIGEDRFETRYFDDNGRCCNYKLIKNGTVLLSINPGFTTYDPNLGFWNIGGKLVWELGGYTSTIIVDGINFNEKYQLQGSYKPYEINGKLIYIAEQNDKLRIVYDDQAIGPEFDDISMPNCCGMMYLFRGGGQYWFVGTREEKMFLVSIQSLGQEPD